eukprot:SAG31_NODE_6255_length_2101_cov_1.641359_2_plen_285_part_00
MAYFTFGPEYIFPGNCYSNSKALNFILAEQHQAHSLIGAAEHVLWPARRVAARVAILHHLSSNAWDPAGTAKSETQLEYTMCYQAEQFGLYLALAVHGGTAVDFIDEFSLLNSTVMRQYDVLFVTQPNVPRLGLRALGAWMQEGGKLVLSAGAAQLDETNSTDSYLRTVSGIHMAPMSRRLLSSGPLPFAAAGQLMSHGVAEVFKAFGGTARFTEDLPENTTVLATWNGTATDALQAIAAVERPIGSGAVVHFGWQPGLSYLVNANSNGNSKLQPSVRVLTLCL